LGGGFSEDILKRLKERHMRLPEKIFLVTLTFDLAGARPPVYAKITAALKKIDLYKALKIKSRGIRFSSKTLNPKSVRLPSNTFVAKITKRDLRKAKQITQQIKEEVHSIFERHQVKGRYFISTGREWSWGAGTIDGRKKAK
jgi:hypothetical protein